MIVTSQSDLVNTAESVLIVCVKPNHTNKRKVRKEREIEVLRNCGYSYMKNADSRL